MTVTAAPGNVSGKPMLRISNRFLRENSGFEIGTKVKVLYQQNQLIITRIIPSL